MSLRDLLTVIFGIFIVIDGSTSIADSIECARAHVEGWVGMLILSVVTVVLGGLVMFGPFDTVMIFAGISLIIDGICDIIMICVFSHKVREAKKKSSTTRTTLSTSTDAGDTRGGLFQKSPPHPSKL